MDFTDRKMTLTLTRDEKKVLIDFYKTLECLSHIPNLHKLVLNAIATDAPNVFDDFEIKYTE
jgi:hypothetical protein